MEKTTQLTVVTCRIQTSLPCGEMDHALTMNTTYVRWLKVWQQSLFIKAQISRKYGQAFINRPTLLTQCVRITSPIFFVVHICYFQLQFGGKLPNPSPLLELGPTLQFIIHTDKLPNKIPTPTQHPMRDEALVT